MPSYSAADRDEMTARAVELRARQWSFNRIALDLGVHHDTAKKWVENEHARRSEHRGVDKESHLAVYDAIQAAAWEAFENTSSSSLNRSGYLNTIKSAEDSKAKITGAEAPIKHQDVTDTFEIVFDDEELIEAER